VARGAYGTAALTLGTLLVGGIDLAAGLILGAAAYGAQIVVGAVLTRKLDRVDRISLALGQQNGVTAIILALSLEPMFPRAVGLVAPAIVTVNCLHFAANTLWARRQSDGAEIGAAPVKGPEPDAAHAGGVGPGPEGQAPSVQPQLPAADSVPPWKTQGDDADAVWWKSHTDTQRHRVHGDLALIALRLAASAVPGMSAHSPFRKFEAMEAVASDSGDTNSM
jgi:hypothetical protein